MLLRILGLLLFCVLCLGDAGCQQKKTKAEENAEKERVWRERQRKEAIKAYTNLVNSYPDSPFAAQARERLQQLQPATPAGK